MLDCCFGALAKMCPDKVGAATDGGAVGVSLGGYFADRSPFIFVEFGCGAWGGRPWADGIEGNASLFANFAATSVEVTEADVPVQILAFEHVQDGMGAGKFRGGAPYRREYRLLEGESTLQIRNDRRAFRPFGLYGGKPAQPSINVLNPQAENEIMTSKVTRYIRRGDIFRFETAGGGGWGDPYARNTAQVLKDVRNEFVSVTAARAEYGVVVDTESWTVDEAATARLRADLRAERGWTEPPFIDRGPLPEGVAAE
jgi:N-methylhydantoinase B